MKKSLLNILFWSVVSAAFIGPGTITTAAKSGSLFGLDLLWALLFSTLACILLQEAASRITIVSGKNLGEALFSKLNTNKAGKISLIIISSSIYFGAAAYEMGNLIGAREGISLLFPGHESLWVLILFAVATAILMIPSLKIIARIMGVLVMILGVSFLIAAVKIGPDLNEIATGLFSFHIPKNPQAPILILGLIGTTIVPYNLFLGSGITNNKHSLFEMRSGLVVAVILGGIFSMAVLIVGTKVAGNFSYVNLSQALNNELGNWGRILLGTGLFAAGFTSAITAPLAAAITLKSIYGTLSESNWNSGGKYFRLSWIIILIVGTGFALMDIKPVPAIILAQALNGLILPFISFYLVWLINDPYITRSKNSILNNSFLFITLVVSLVTGLRNLASVFGKISFLNCLNNSSSLIVILIVSIIFTGAFMIRIYTKNEE
ncbi:MAG: divalent metal cation transporter [Bacteroidales bacterium]|nr:divalent metal cation transporter [Bacteroidales bacterium]MCF8392073.1 divalent metal cation transporter [Bacteroidales bacterium]